VKDTTGSFVEVGEETEHVSIIALRDKMEALQGQIEQSTAEVGLNHQSETLFR
jgi:hypothetical protein